MVSISVPSDKARAVVDAMERDMGTTLATKQDLERHALATKQDLSLLATREELLELKQGVAILRRDMESRFTLVEQKIDLLRHDVSRNLGSMLFVGFGLTIAAMRLWV